jgi:hypothetical protein
MKNIFKKNSIIITALAIMIVIAGYLSFTTRDSAKDEKGTVAVNDQNAVDVDGTDLATTADTTTTPTPTKGATTGNDTNTNTNTNTNTDTNELGSKDAQKVADNGELDLDDGTPGEAVLATTADASYFVSSKIQREQVRAQNKADYLEIINSPNASAADKKAATNHMLQLVDDRDKELAAEVLLGAKGFSDAIVLINNGKVEVAVNAASLTKQQTAIIEEVVKEKTGIGVANMHINPIVLQD